MTVAEQIFERVKTMPDALAREVLDFAAFLSERAEKNGLSFAQSSGSTWDDDCDSVWDEL